MSSARPLPGRSPVAERAEEAATEPRSFARFATYGCAFYMTLYPRHATELVADVLADSPVAVIVGPRQSGKSTLAEQVASDEGAEMVSLDDAAPRAAANADPTGFIEERDLPLVIDEFQKAPALLDAIKSRVDRSRRGGRRAAGLSC